MKVISPGSEGKKKKNAFVEVERTVSWCHADDKGSDRLHISKSQCWRGRGRGWRGHKLDRPGFKSCLLSQLTVKAGIHVTSLSLCFITCRMLCLRKLR